MWASERIPRHAADGSSIDWNKNAPFPFDAWLSEDEDRWLAGLRGKPSWVVGLRRG